MKTILLSMRPEGWDLIRTGEKIYEYRKRFLKGEEVLAYLYLSRPVSGISGIIKLSPAIELKKWEDIYKKEIDILHRIENYQNRGNRFVMRVLSYQETNVIPKEMLEKEMEDSHEAIIPKDEWQAVQMEFKRRDVYRKEIGLYAFGNDSSPFSGRLVCSHCGKPYRRCGWSRNGKKFWMCASKKAKEASACPAENIFEESIFEAFRVAWNGVVANKDNLTEKWDDQIENGNPLERLRAKQMKMLIADGAIQTVVPEHVILVLERMIAYDKRHFEVRFLDGTVKQICISE